MRRVLGWIALLLAVLLVALGVYHAAVPDEVSQADHSGAALGLMLLERENGLYVLAVTRDSPAEKAGVEPGDYLIFLDGEPLKDTATLDAVLGGEAEAIPLTLRRNGRELDVLLNVR